MDSTRDQARQITQQRDPMDEETTSVYIFNLKLVIFGMSYGV